MKKIKWCIIGAGGIADRRAIPALLEDPKNEIVAVMDKNPEVAKSVAEKYGVKAYFSDVEAMLSSTTSDAVYIGTPVFCHRDQALSALEHGLHVFMEKPIAMNAAEAEEIISRFKERGKLLMIGYMMRHHNLHRKARAIIEDGGIGDVVSARFQFSCWYPDIPGAWRQKKALGGGGCIMDLAVHCIDLFNFTVGEPIKEIKALYATKTFSYEVEDQAVILLETENKTFCQIDVNFNVPDNAASSKFEIYGTAGSLIAEGTLGQTEGGKLRYIHSPQGGYEAAQNRTAQKPRSFRGNGKNIYLKQFKHFNDLIRAEKIDYANAENALAIQKICDYIYSQK